jgi:hypothetical protein
MRSAGHVERCGEDPCHRNAFAIRLVLDGYLIEAGAPSLQVRARLVQLGSTSIAEATH